MDVPTVLCRGRGCGKVSDPTGTGAVPRSLYSRLQRPRVVHCLSERHYGEHSWCVHLPHSGNTSMPPPMWFTAYIMYIPVWHHVMYVPTEWAYNDTLLGPGFLRRLSTPWRLKCTRMIGKVSVWDLQVCPLLRGCFYGVLHPGVSSIGGSVGETQ